MYNIAGKHFCWSFLIDSFCRKSVDNEFFLLFEDTGGNNF